MVILAPAVLLVPSDHPVYEDIPDLQDLERLDQQEVRDHRDRLDITDLPEFQAIAVQQVIRSLYDCFDSVLSVPFRVNFRGHGAHVFP